MYYSISYDIKSNLYDSSMYIKPDTKGRITLGKLAKKVRRYC
ncbi:hypothetical protein RAMDARK_1672 [Rickettsia amblyommatis str. Darkwater]|uniref:Uncharacterized protein n=1 Tax=Rickettsia amblyommatis str. Ac/Pa TaxID=1359164 RepID=A0A0F3N3T2_RICAM|nr:hypothetical protein APHACPA_1436 [Rickettsia amblyommatis str. Ac/Pa]KJV91340.1 hypothetical protein RAMDARK_1093 [Rickettsia amblyommatis str. Darkwater]KJW00075.1 hypothetical protein RAMDARK_1672 [Rickettsia amblyommatis str. Darkwater]